MLFPQSEDTTQNFHQVVIKMSKLATLLAAETWMAMNVTTVLYCGSLENLTLNHNKPESA